MEIKALRNLDLKQQLLFVESYLPDAWEFLCDVATLPKFDDNDDLVYWGARTPQDTPQEEKE
jgi:hypothetical protein